MDIEKLKKFSRNKIYSDYFTKNVRKEIKEEEWKKQDRIEGLKELYQPIIESQNNIKKSLDDRQNENINRIQNNQNNIRQLIDEIIRNRRTDNNRDLIDSNRQLIDEIIRNRRTDSNRDLIDSNRQLIDEIIRNRRIDNNSILLDEIRLNRDLINNISSNRQQEQQRFIYGNRELESSSDEEIEIEERQRQRQRQRQLQQREILQREREQEQEQLILEQRNIQDNIQRQREQRELDQMLREQMLLQQINQREPAEIEREQAEREQAEREQAEREDEFLLPTQDYEEHLDERFNELVNKNSAFDSNLLDKNSLRILFSHNFYSLPSDYYERYNYQDFEYRKNDVHRLLNLYYNKIKDLAVFGTTRNNNYQIAKIKDGITNRELKKLIQNDIKNFNTLSIYDTNLGYAFNAKNNLYNN